MCVLILPSVLQLLHAIVTCQQARMLWRRHIQRMINRIGTCGSGRGCHDRIGVHRKVGIRMCVRVVFTGCHRQKRSRCTVLLHFIARRWCNFVERVVLPLFLEPLGSILDRRRDASFQALFECAFATSQLHCMLLGCQSRLGPKEGTLFDIRWDCNAFSVSFSILAVAISQGLRRLLNHFFLRNDLPRSLKSTRPSPPSISFQEPTRWF